MNENVYSVTTSHYMITVELWGRRMNAVRNLWGWNVAWRKGKGPLQWRTLRTEAGAVAFMSNSLNSLAYPR